MFLSWLAMTLLIMERVKKGEFSLDRRVGGSSMKVIFYFQKYWFAPTGKVVSISNPLQPLK